MHLDFHLVPLNMQAPLAIRNYGSQLPSYKWPIFHGAFPLRSQASNFGVEKFYVANHFSILTSFHQ